MRGPERVALSGRCWTVERSPSRRGKQTQGSCAQRMSRRVQRSGRPGLPSVLFWTPSPHQQTPGHPMQRHDRWQSRSRCSCDQRKRSCSNSGAWCWVARRRVTLHARRPVKLCMERGRRVCVEGHSPVCP